MNEMTLAERNRKREKTAALRTGPMTLDKEHADKMAAILKQTYETRSIWFRRMIRENYAQLFARS